MEAWSLKVIITYILTWFVSKLNLSKGVKICRFKCPNIRCNIYVAPTVAHKVSIPATVCSCWSSLVDYLVWLLKIQYLLLMVSCSSVRCPYSGSALSHTISGLSIVTNIGPNIVVNIDDIILCLSNIQVWPTYSDHYWLYYIVIIKATHIPERLL